MCPTETRRRLRRRRILLRVYIYQPSGVDRLRSRVYIHVHSAVNPILLRHLSALLPCCRFCHSRQAPNQRSRMMRHDSSPVLVAGRRKQIGCLVKDFTPSDWMEGKDAKRQGRYTQFAMAATKLALEDAKLDAEALEKVNKDKFGVLIGSGIGGVEFFENNCQKFNDAGAGAKGLKKVHWGLGTAVCM